VGILTFIPAQLEKKKAHTIRKLHDKDPALGSLFHPCRNLQSGIYGPGCPEVSSIARRSSGCPTLPAF
jgi:hypothetical protein